jgi:hypothetical protein
MYVKVANVIRAMQNVKRSNKRGYINTAHFHSENLYS